MPRTSKKEVEDAEVREVKHIHATPQWQLVAIGVLGTVLLLALFVAGMRIVAGLHHARTVPQMGRMTEPGQRGGSHFDRHEGFGGRTHVDGAVAGVITAIDGDTLTIGGGGKQVKVKKTDSTKVGGDKTDVAVNDTVVILGDKDSDGNVSAVRIIVRNNNGVGAMAPDA
jgi:hypothetical protein